MTSATMEHTETVVTGVTLPASVLRDGLTGALVSAGKDDMLPTLTGIRIEWDSVTNEVRFVSTDRYRLSLGVTTGTPVGESHAVLVPRKDAEALVKALPKAPRYGTEYTAVTLTTTGDGTLSVLFTGDGTWTREFRLLDGQFPKYDTLIPDGTTEPVSEMAWNPVYMADAAKIPHEKNDPIRFMFTAPNRPMVGTYLTCNGIDWTYLVMPSRIAG